MIHAWVCVHTHKRSHVHTRTVHTHTQTNTDTLSGTAAIIYTEENPSEHIAGLYN